MGYSTDSGSTYSLPTGYIFVFNLIVGVGALNLPYGFSNAGITLATIFLAFLAFSAYSTVLLLLEAMATANAYMSLMQTKTLAVEPSERDFDSSSIYVEDVSEKRPLRVINEDVEPSSEEDVPLRHNSGVFRPADDLKEMQLFSMRNRFEVGVMAQMFMGRVGALLFYVVLVVYLYGDLAIYAVTVPKELSRVTGGVFGLTELEVYYIFLSGFILIITPFCFFNFQKTKYLQIATMLFRNLALLLMIVLSVVHIILGGGTIPSGKHLINVMWFPKLFGVTIYSFMCHHSLPSLVTPIKNKKWLGKVMGLDFLTILITYYLLCYTATVAFGGATHTTCSADSHDPCIIQPLYTENFLSYSFKPVSYLLNLFPVFTLSTNYPLISITLRNNLMNVVQVFPPAARALERSAWSKRLIQPAFSAIAAIPPFAIAYATQDVSILVGFTGSYAGLLIMFLIPVLLNFFSRRTISKLVPDHAKLNPHRTFFGNWIYLIFICLWSAVALLLVSFNHINELIPYFTSQK